MKKVLFLDLNGTCVDDWGLSHAGVAAIFQAYNKPVPSLEEYVCAVAMDGGYHQFYLDRGISATRDELYAIYTPTYYAHMKEVQVMPGLHNALAALKYEGIEIHLVSAARRDFAAPLVLAASLAEYCESMHFHVHDKAEQVRAIIHGMDYVRPDECAMMGDLPSDMRDAESADIAGIAFLNPHIPRRLFSGTRIDYAVLEFSGIVPFLCDA